MIALYTDFGWDDPYVGQMHAAIHRHAADAKVIDLFHAVPSFAIKASAYLLPAYSRDFPEQTIFVCVVDPGVGSKRAAVAYHIDGRWYVGPDNGIFALVGRFGKEVKKYRITLQPKKLSHTFHGRDLFAPVAAKIYLGDVSCLQPIAESNEYAVWPDDLAEVIYIDHYGNAITGIRGSALDETTTVLLGNYRISYAKTFSEINIGEAFWHTNANGLVEIAMNQASAAKRLDIRYETKITLD